MDDVQTAIYVAIRTSPRRLRVALASKNPTEGDEATNQLVDRIVKALEQYDVVLIEREPENFSANCGHPQM
ncbi:hypothetical protein [Hyphomonas sp.]|uniref:hypothetical protein n=1 Tax=Hyphomonas sp. TaxID=87 RepID=UPI0030F6EEB0